MANAVKFIDDHQIPKLDKKVGWFFSNLTRFAVDSALTLPSKGLHGGKKAYQIVEERLKHQPPPVCLNAERKLEPIKEMQAKMDEMHEEWNHLKQQSKTSISTADESKPQMKTPNDGVSKGSYLPKPNEKRVFIRSRL